jgi:hypothetical protein
MPLKVSEGLGPLGLHDDFRANLNLTIILRRIYESQYLCYACFSVFCPTVLETNTLG